MRADDEYRGMMAVGAVFTIISVRV